MAISKAHDGGNTAAPNRAEAGYGVLFEDGDARKHRLVILDDGPAMVRRVALAGGDELVIIRVGSVPRDGGEDTCSAAFAAASVAWLASRSTSPLPPGDVEWFATRPGRRHRIRPALPAERGGRPEGQWSTIVALAHGRHLRLCLDEATLPRGDRGEDGLAAILSDRASALASGHALELSRHPVPRPAPASPTRPDRPAKPPASTVPVQGKPPARAPVDAVTARPAATAARGVTERWKDKAESKPVPLPWPAMSLPAALDLARMLRTRYGRGPIRLYDLKATFGEDAAAAKVAALKAFRLVSVGSDGMSRLTATGHDALDGCPIATASAALSPAPYRALADAFGHDATPEQVAASDVARDRSRAEALDLHAGFAATVRLVAPAGAPA